MSGYGGSSVVNRGQATSHEAEVENAEKLTRPETGSAPKILIRQTARKESDLGNLASLARITLVAVLLAGAVVAVVKMQGGQVIIKVEPPIFDDQIPSFQVSDKILHQMLEDSDKQFLVNQAARLSLKRGVLKAAKIDIRELKEDWLLPLYPCPLEGRFGFWGEGGKWVCLRHHAMRRPPLVVSIGSRGDKSFEEDIATRLGGFSHTFDYSLSAEDDEKMQSYSFLKFYKLGLWGSTQKEYYTTRFPNATFITVRQMLKTVGAMYVDIFKIDCEGCEHKVVEDLGRLYTRSTVPFGQILMEIHWLAVTDVQLTTLLTLEKLGYRMFHTEVNAIWDQGYEISLIHEKLVDPEL